MKLLKEVLALSMKDSLQDMKYAMQDFHRDLAKAKSDGDGRKEKHLHDAIFDLGSLMVKKEKEEKK